jgi:hypothetical protein
MDNFTNGSGHRFWQGAFFGFIGWAGLLFHSGFGYWVDAISKLIGSSILAGVTGLFTMLCTDFYKQKLKNRIFKRKKDKDEQDKERAA